MTCPHHPKQDTSTNKRNFQHVQTDLAFSKNGVRKRLLKYIGHKAYCPICGLTVSRHQRLSRLKDRMFGHNFLVLGGIPASRSDATSCRDQPDARSPLLRICGQIHDLQVHPSVERMTTRTRKRCCWRNILQSPFIHVDETKISIQGRNWYVWVLTDGKHVVFRLTDSRETTLIHKMLGGL